MNETGVMESRRNGEGRAGYETVAPEGLRNDKLCWREMLSARPARNLLSGVTGGLVWHARLREKASDVGRDAVCTVSPTRRALAVGALPSATPPFQSKTEMREGVAENHGTTRFPEVWLASIGPN